MKVLLVTPFFPYAMIPHAGGRFVHELLKHIAAGHDVSLVSRIESSDLSRIEEIKPLCSSINLLQFKTPSQRNPFRVLLITISYIRLSLMANKIAAEKNFDVVQVEFIETGLAIKRSTKAFYVLDAHDVISKPAMRRYNNSRNFLLKALHFLNWKITGMIEETAINKFDRVFTRSPQDREVLCSAHNYQGKVDIVPHPINIPNLSLDKSVPGDPATILFVGSLDRDVNREAVLFTYHKILPLIKGKLRDLKYYIIGDKAPADIIKLANEDSAVRVTGFVEDLLPYYQRTTFVVTPLFIGGGIIVKNMEAMAHGVPVITTSIGNEGIGAVNGRDLLIAETPEEFANAIIELLKNPDKREAIGMNGREFIRKHFHMDAVFDNIDAIYDELHKKI
jgi:glycosyltransferase involved in cell wall biosynthesis